MDAKRVSPATLLFLLWRGLGYDSNYRREALNILRDFEMFLTSVAAHKPEGRTNDEMENSLLRLRLILYAQFVELVSVYSLLDNVLAIGKGEIDVHPNKDEVEIHTATFRNLGTDAFQAVETLRNDLSDGHDDLSQRIGRFYDNRLRNGIFHTQFHISGDTITYRHNRSEYTITKAEFLEKFVDVMEFFGAFLELSDGVLREIVTMGPINDGALVIEPEVEGDSLGLRFRSS